MNDQARPSRMGSAADVRPEDVPRHAGRVVRRILQRHGTFIDPETAQLIADALLALFQASPPLPRSPLADPGTPGRSAPASGGGRMPLRRELGRQ
jgi:hypothetical protein